VTTALDFSPAPLAAPAARRVLRAGTVPEPTASGQTLENVFLAHTRARVA